MKLVTVNETDQPVAAEYYQQLESGNVLFFPKTPFEFAKEDIDFLLDQRQQDASYHKNIAYKPKQDKVTDVASSDQRGQLRSIMSNYCKSVTVLLTTILPRYAEKWDLDCTCFRPQEEEGLELSLHSRNDLLHVDAFPGKPDAGNLQVRFDEGRARRARRCTHSPTLPSFALLFHQNKNSFL